MNCFYCERGDHPGGLHYGTDPAIGLCHDCGVAVCLKHGKKSEGKPLYCDECLERRKQKDAQAA